MVENFMIPRSSSCAVMRPGCRIFLLIELSFTAVQAVAVAAALNVVEPFMSGLGGGGWMQLLCAETGEHVTIDYCGRIPQAATPALMTPQARNQGPRSPTVPGSPAGWLAVLERFGSMTAAQVFAPAVELARRGFPLTTKNAGVFCQLKAIAAKGVRAVAANREHFLRTRCVIGSLMVEFFNASLEIFGGTPESEECRRVYTMGGEFPQLGMVLRQPELANTLEQLAAEGPDAFYGKDGSLGSAVVAELNRLGGLINSEDLASYEPEWGTPVTTTYRGHTVAVCAPPGRGIQVLECLNILEAFPIGSGQPGWGHNEAETLVRLPVWSSRKPSTTAAA
eukprot:SAG31_NODE_41_length_31342_cov_8.029286_5_plen_337_part_00